MLLASRGRRIAGSGQTQLTGTGSVCWLHSYQLAVWQQLRKTGSQEVQFRAEYTEQASTGCPLSWGSCPSGSSHGGQPHARDHGPAETERLRYNGSATHRRIGSQAHQERGSKGLALRTKEDHDHPRWGTSERRVTHSHHQELRRPRQIENHVSVRHRGRSQPTGPLLY